jgi:hypothetical protein
MCLALSRKPTSKQVAFYGHGPSFSAIDMVLSCLSVRESGMGEVLPRLHAYLQRSAYLLASATLCVCPASARVQMTTHSFLVPDFGRFWSRSRVLSCRVQITQSAVLPRVAPPPLRPVYAGLDGSMGDTSSYVEFTL